MKLRLTQPGFATYTGQMGVIFFEDGLSTNDVLVQDAVRMAAVMICEWEDGTSPSVAQSILDNADTPAPTFVSGDDGQHELTAEQLAASGESQTQEPVPAGGYTAEQLAAVADKEGINGLRKIAEPLGIKSNSIVSMIDQILKAGAPVAGE